MIKQNAARDAISAAERGGKQNEKERREGGMKNRASGSDRVSGRESRAETDRLAGRETGREREGGREGGRAWAWRRRRRSF